MGILSSFYNKMFGPAQPVSTFHATDRYKHYFGSNEFKLVESKPIPDRILRELTQPKELKALIPRKVGIWKTAEATKFLCWPITWPCNAIDDVASFLTGKIVLGPGGDFDLEEDTSGYRPLAAIGRGIGWIGSLPHRTCAAAGSAWNNYAPNEWAFDGSWIKLLTPDFLSWSPAGDEALAKKIEMNDVLEANARVRKMHHHRVRVLNPQTLYQDEAAHIANLAPGDIEGYNKHLRKVYGDERIGLLFRKAQAHLLRTAKEAVRSDYASQSGIKDKTKMAGFQANFNAQLKHLPKAIESASAAIDELLKSFSSRESDFLNEVASLKEKLAAEEARIPSLDKIVERLLSIPEVTESLSLHQAVLALPRKVNNPEQLHLVIQGLSKVMAVLRQQKAEDNAEKIDQTDADLSSLEQFWPTYNHLKETLSAYEEISKVGKDLRSARKDLLGVPEGFKDTFEKHPKTLLALVRAFETLKEVENLPVEMKGFAEYFVSTLKESIHIRAVASTELARILHYGLNVDPMQIPGMYTDLQSDYHRASHQDMAAMKPQDREKMFGHNLYAMPLQTIFKPQEFPQQPSDAMWGLGKDLEEIIGLGAKAELRDPALQAYNQFYKGIQGRFENLTVIFEKLAEGNLSQPELLVAIEELRQKFGNLKEAFRAEDVPYQIRDYIRRTEGDNPRHVFERAFRSFEEAEASLEALAVYVTNVYESPKEKRARIGNMLKGMKETAKKELTDSPYKTPEELLLRAGLDFRFLELFLDLGSKEKDKRIKDLKKTFDLMAPAWAVGMDPEEAIENGVQEELWKQFQDFLKAIVPGMKRSDVMAAEMTDLKTSIPIQLKNALELLENICGSEKGMNLIVASLDEKNPKRRHAYGNLFFRGVGIGQYMGDAAGKNESSLKRYRQALDFYSKAVNEALEYRVGFDENPLVTGNDVNTFRHAAKKAGYFLQSAEAMVRFENLLKNASDYLSTEGPTRPDRETWTLFVEKLLRRLNAAISAEEKMTGVVIAEHWLFQDYGQGPAARNEDGTMAPQDGLDARASAHLARVLARKGVFGVLDPEVEEMVKNIPPKPHTRPGDGASAGTFGADAAMANPHGGHGGVPDPKRDYAQENRVAHVEFLRPAVRMAGHAKNPSNLVMLYRVKAMLLDAIRRPEDADTARRNALQRKEEGIIDKNDFFFDEKKFQELYEQFGGLEEKEQQLAL